MKNSACYKLFVNQFLILPILGIMLLMHHNVRANAAQPGIYNAGGTIFTLLYEEDSSSYKKIQMVNESIFIQLYPGFAVVKGGYEFHNSTSENLQFKMGYPVNGIYQGGEVYLNQVQIDSLNSFRIYEDSNRLDLIKANKKNVGRMLLKSSENWMVWQMDFAANEVKEITVYFIVNTNNAVVREGYNKAKENSFIYLLESGRIWKQPIVEANFYVQLREDLGQNDIHGISGGFNFKWNKNLNMLWGSKQNFSPKSADNLVIRYGASHPNFDFEKVVSFEEVLYSTIDDFSEIDLKSGKFETFIGKDLYSVEGDFWNKIPGFLIISFTIFNIIFWIVLIYIIYIRLKKYRNKKIQ